MVLGSARVMGRRCVRADGPSPSGNLVMAELNIQGEEMQASSLGVRSALHSQRERSTTPGLENRRLHHDDNNREKTKSQPETCITLTKNECLCLMMAGHCEIAMSWPTSCCQVDIIAMSTHKHNSTITHDTPTLKL